ncbi:Uncharacterised protein [Arthrobacter agilis]|nr:Uncharacterised protein [Arthrobacter agilis]
MSCDLVGSTHFKQTEPGWQKIFLSFYWEFPQFIHEANRVQAEIDGGQTAFRLWKAVGDELIFEVLVGDEAAVSRAVRVWIRAIDEYEKQVLIDRKLALKGGAFIATFPGPDSESTVPIDPGEGQSDEPVVHQNAKALSGQRAPTKYLYDYFGPSVDTGFRIFGHSSRRYFTLSVEVAWAISLAAHSAAGQKVGFETHTTKDFVFRGAHVLKGVWRAREYPIFAIDRESRDAVNEAVSAMNGSAISASKIIDVCHACATDENWPFSLYLPNSTNEAFQVEPEDAMAGLYHSEPTLEGAETVDRVSLRAGEDLIPANTPLG